MIEQMLPHFAAYATLLVGAFVAYGKSQTREALQNKRLDDIESRLGKGDDKLDELRSEINGLREDVHAIRATCERIDERTKR